MATIADGVVRVTAKNMAQVEQFIRGELNLQVEPILAMNTQYTQKQAMADLELICADYHVSPERLAQIQPASYVVGWEIQSVEGPRRRPNVCHLSKIAAVQSLCDRYEILAYDVEPW